MAFESLLSPLLLSLLSSLLGLLLLLGGGEALVNGARRLARMSGMSPLLIGLTVVAFGTSLPELFVSVLAVWQGHPGIMLGNVIGSNIANVGLILAISILLVPIHLKFKDVATELSMLHLATAILFGLTVYGFFPRLVGWFFVGSLIVYLIWAYRAAAGDKPRSEAIKTVGVKPRGEPELEPGGETGSARLGVDQPTAPEKNSGAPDANLPAKVRANESGSVERVMGGAVAKIILLVLGGLAALIVGAEVFLWGVVSLAEKLGVSELVIGLTVVAVGTSLPELATSFAAIRHRQDAIMVGNIIGSNLFNLLAVMGITAAIIPFALPPQLLQRDLPVMLFFSLLLLVAIRYRGRLGRGLGLVLLAAYVGYLVILIQLPA